MDIQTLIEQRRAADAAYAQEVEDAERTAKRLAAQRIKELLGPLAGQILPLSTVDVDLRESDSGLILDAAWVPVVLSHWNPEVRQMMADGRLVTPLILSLRKSDISIAWNPDHGSNRRSQPLFYDDCDVSGYAVELLEAADDIYRDMHAEQIARARNALHEAHGLRFDLDREVEAKAAVARLIALDPDNADVYNEHLRTWQEWRDGQLAEHARVRAEREAARRLALEEAEAFAEQYRAWELAWQAAHDHNTAVVKQAQDELDKDEVTYYSLWYRAADNDDDGLPVLRDCAILAINEDLHGPHTTLSDDGRVITVRFANPVYLLGPFVAAPSDAPRDVTKIALSVPGEWLVAHPYTDLDEVVRRVRESAVELPKPPSLRDNATLLSWLFQWQVDDFARGEMSPDKLVEAVKNR